MSDKPQPSALLLRFFRWFCHPDYLEDIEGDLWERFEILVEDMGPRRARRRFVWEVLSLVRPNLIRSVKDLYPYNPLPMYKNYFKIAWRNLLRQKLYSFLNISGLAVGLCSFVLIFMYVQHEFSYDQFVPDADRVYRVYQRQEGNTYLGSDYFALTPAPLSRTLIKEYPEVETATTFQTPKYLINYKEVGFWEEGLNADPSFFEVFKFDFIQGEASQALQDPSNIVITQSLSRKIFGQGDPIGKTIDVKVHNQEKRFTVTGLIADLPRESSLQFTFVSSILGSGGYKRDTQEDSEHTWENNSYHTFFTLKAGASIRQLEAKFPALLEKYKPKDEDFPFNISFLVQRLSDFHFEAGINFDFGLKGNRQYIQIFSIIALVVLLLACINYMNLAIARSIRRAREVGLRKVIGATRGQLIGQFLGESFLITLLAFVLALLLVQLVLPLFSAMLDRDLLIWDLYQVRSLGGVLLIILAVALISGSYPAFFMSSLKPHVVIKGKLGRKLSGLGIQKILVIAQYACSIVLIISSLVIYRQSEYVQNKELGYDREHIINIFVQDAQIRKKYAVIAEEIQKEPQVVSLTSSDALPTNIDSSSLIEQGPTDSTQKQEIAIYRNSIGYDFLKVFGIKLLAGRDFSPDYPQDAEKRVIVNETTLKALGWNLEEAVGRKFSRYGDSIPSTEIIGVVQDFHMHSLHQPIEPLMLFLQGDYFRFISVKVRPENLSQTLNRIEAIVQAHTVYPFEYSFLDERFDQLYKTDQKLGEMFGFFTVLSVLIASLGLFGLAAISAKQRTKEIGIRKVLGASIESIVQVLARDFMKMVAWGFVLAVPFAWYFMHRWLEDYAYRISLQWWMFALPGLMAFVIALFTISFQSMKAARANPVESLRNE